MRRMLTVVAAMAAFGLVSVGAALAEGPPQGPFDNNDGVWACEGEASLPPYHCINVKSKGNTGVIKVFAPDARWPQEGISFDPKSDTRPCPHDPSSPDGTWWEVLPGVWVCHHRP